MNQEQGTLLQFFFRSFLNDLELLLGKELSGASLAVESPRTILDLAGSQLFFDIDILDESRKSLGYLRSGAGREDLPLIDSIVFSNGLPPFDVLVSRARTQAAIDFPGKAADNPRFVCYGYPLIGIMLDVAGDASTQWVLYNPYNKSIVRQGATKQELTSIERGFESIEESIEGEPLYSIAGRIPEAGPEEGPTQEQWRALRGVFEQYDAEGGDVKVLMSRARINVREQTVAADLIAQETPVYCVVATAAMILEFFGQTALSQTDIAGLLGTTAKGTPPAALATQLGGISGSKLATKQIGSPTFGDFVRELQPGFPDKSGIPGHSRLVCGWREYELLDSEANPLHTERFLVVADPQPVGIGALVLESLCKPIPDYFRNAMSVSKVV